MFDVHVGARRRASNRMMLLRVREMIGWRALSGMFLLGVREGARWRALRR